MGSTAAPAFADLDGDGDLDALVGNNDGNTLLFLNVPVTGPSAPSAPDLAATSDSGSSSTDNLTNVTTPTVTGAATAGDTVVLYDGATASGTATADGSGLWTITAGTLSGGAHTLTARAIDGTGTSSASSALVVTVDTTALCRAPQSTPRR